MASVGKIVPALLLVIAPLLFVWHAELVLIYPRDTTTLTNGLADFDGGVVYHVLMYGLLAVNVLGAVLLLRDD